MNDNNAIKLRAIISFYLHNKTEHDIHIVEFIHRSFYQYFLAYYIYYSIESIIKNKSISEVQSFLKSLCYRRLDKDTLLFIEKIAEFKKSNFEDEDIQVLLEQIQTMDLWCVFNVLENNLNYKLLDENIGKPYIRQTIILSNILSMLCYLKKGLGSYLDISKKQGLIELLKLFETKGKFPFIKISLYNQSIEYTLSSLIEADLRNANLRHVDLNSANLIGANLRNTNLGNVNLSGADLKSADLRKAHLNYTNLRSSDLSSANLSGANLSGIKINKENLKLKWF